MATETLHIPEEDLEEVIAVIRTGLDRLGWINNDLRHHLLEWCDEEEEYLQDMQSED